MKRLKRLLRRIAREIVKTDYEVVREAMLEEMTVSQLQELYC